METATKEWTTIGGMKIPVDEMSINHIENALAMLKRKGYVKPETVLFYLTCSPPQGDMASYAFDGECDQIFNAPTSKFIKIFEDELERRKSFKKW